MTGFEHALGALMIGRGMVQEGVQVVGAVRRRHDGLARNPWDEPEYGHHYARAMASWSSLVAWSGFRYDARDHVVYLRPASGGSIRSFWSSATGWGTFTYEPGIGRSKLRLSLLEGELVLARISLPPFGTTRTVLTLDGQPLPHEVEPAKAATVLNFAERTLRAG